jgi:hypothetical protein
MLKRLAIVGLLVLAGGAWPQVPGNGSGQHDRAQDKQESTNHPKPVVAVDSQHAANNQQQAAEKPPKYPWSELLAPANIPNWFLVVVGAVTGWFVYRTLKAIKRQADLMEAQAKDARESGAQTFAILKEQTDNLLISAKAATVSAMAADESSKAANAQIQMIKNKERARIALAIVEPDVLEFGSNNNSIKIIISNLGPTHAWNVKATGDARGILYEDRPRMIGKVRMPDLHTYTRNPIHDPVEFREEDLDAPRVIFANAKDIEIWISFAFPEEWDDDILLRPHLAIQARGSVEYEDVFGDSHETSFSYEMRISKWGEVNPEGTAVIKPFSPFSRWFPIGADGGNRAT